MLLSVKEILNPEIVGMSIVAKFHRKVVGCHSLDQCICFLCSSSFLPDEILSSILWIVGNTDNSTLLEKVLY